MYYATRRLFNRRQIANPLRNSCDETAPAGSIIFTILALYVSPLFACEQQPRGACTPLRRSQFIYDAAEQTPRDAYQRMRQPLASVIRLSYILTGNWVRELGSEIHRGRTADRPAYGKKDWRGLYPPKDINSQHLKGKSAVDAKILAVPSQILPHETPRPSVWDYSRIFDGKYGVRDGLNRTVKISSRGATGRYGG
ncbi:hypothetical protein C8R44DRAFT_751175 [Mycena epipterygia]|nr:hypothetical protein C8R44DRAFT_751175 [Mycena epipterygia]